MAVRNIAVTDTLEKFRTEFNDLNSNDFGDIANLSSQISATNLVEAMNETISMPHLLLVGQWKTLHQLNRLWVVVMLQDF